MGHLLLVDDEEDILDILAFNLQSDGHEVSKALTGSQALALASERKPDLVILDLMLPDISGTEVARRLRENPETKDVLIVMLTARSEEIDRVVGFELGADDYVPKPFSVREVLLRVRAHLRRTRQPDDRSSPRASVEFGELKIDPEAHRVWVAGAEIDLTALEFKLLLTLFERRNRVQTRGTLLQGVWGIQAEISTRTVDAHVKRLREKLKTARNYIETVRGVGYRFIDSPTENKEGDDRRNVGFDSTADINTKAHARGLDLNSNLSF